MIVICDSDFEKNHTAPNGIIGFAGSPESHTTSDEVRADLAVKQNESSGLARKGKSATVPTGTAWRFV